MPQHLGVAWKVGTPADYDHTLKTPQHVLWKRENATQKKGNSVCAVGVATFAAVLILQSIASPQQGSQKSILDLIRATVVRIYIKKTRNMKLTSFRHR